MKVIIRKGRAMFFAQDRADDAAITDLVRVAVDSGVVEVATVFKGGETTEGVPQDCLQYGSKGNLYAVIVSNE